jgi:5-methylcytosine-specific restriction endonuclease McrA
MRLKLCRCGGVREDRQGSVCIKCGVGKSKPKQSTKDAGYGWDWQQLSVRFRKENPLCGECARHGIATAAEEVHHKVSIAESPWLRLEWSNLMSVCVPCHRRLDEQRRNANV